MELAPTTVFGGEPSVVRERLGRSNMHRGRDAKLRRRAAGVCSLESSEHEEHHYCHDAGADQDGGSHAGSCHVIAISRVLILLTVELNGLLNLDWRIYRNIANSFQDKNKFVGASICD